jgi:hypothetical protein
MTGALMGKAFVGLNKRLIKFRGVGKDRFRQSWDDVPVPVSRGHLVWNRKWDKGPVPMSRSFHNLLQIKLKDQIDQYDDGGARGQVVAGELYFLYVGADGVACDFGQGTVG